MSDSLQVTLHNQTFHLHSTGACYWQEQDVVLLADVHLGKSAHFRKHGMAVPSQADDNEYDKLNAVIDYFKPSRLWFLGDLFHSYQNAEWHFFEQWSRMQSIELTLVMGNHDLISSDHFNMLGIKTVQQLQMGDVLLTHHPLERENVFNIAGHIHPAVKLTGIGRQRLKMPCFFCTDYGMIVPAFGDFTGTYAMKPQKGNRIFVCVENEVVELS
ncbi:ligase-associated DNA damage response endonuclease PdeM [Nonlabens agnitus]|uniref:Metallophosphoesterase n=1 Tax=Nonlabens agnitus TaxID=870484 RepID=A0A2S9WVL9_9FLAO|nr:ligase-associated DNA damage response endonuclease PdeM [Nonlabens agnitus]PRP67514.1 metallophosphoesterase [Nonlabens agnitus]